MNKRVLTEKTISIKKSWWYQLAKSNYAINMKRKKLGLPVKVVA